MSEIEQIAALIQFARWAISNSACLGCALDGADVEAEAVKLGLLQEFRATEPCSEGCACAEFGFPATCYRFADFMQSSEA
jgi:hypothetical protein